MRKTAANPWCDFDPFEPAVVGRADFTCIPPPEPATEAKIPDEGDMRGMRAPHPLEAVEKEDPECRREPAPRLRRDR